MIREVSELYNKLRDAVDGKLKLSEIEDLLVDFAEPFIEKMRNEINASPRQVKEYLYKVIRFLEKGERHGGKITYF